MLNKIIYTVICLLVVSTTFAQIDAPKKSKPLSHFPNYYDKEPGFYSVSSETNPDDREENENGVSGGGDEELEDYFGDFDEDSDEDHKKAEMYASSSQDDLFAETEEIPVRDKNHVWFAEDTNIVIARSHYKNGRLRGRYRKWTDDGNQLITDMAYKKGKAMGKATLYHANGKLKSKTYYKKGKLNGPYERYDEDGDKVRQGWYDNGKKEGEHITYHKNGQIKTVTNYKKGQKDGAYIEYDENGKEIRSENFVKGLKEGTSDGIKYKKNKKGKIYKFRISEDNHKVKIEKTRVK